MNSKSGKFKVVHLSTFYKGGAGIAACRLHKAMLKEGVDSYIGFVQAGDMVKHLERAFSVNQLSIKQRLKNTVYRLLYTSKYEKLLNKLLFSIDAENCILPFSNYNPLDHVIVKSADIIHLHWVCGMIDYLDFFKKCTKPIIWTLHDMYPMQGLFIYKDDDQKNYLVAKELDTYVRNLKEIALHRFTNKLVITAPSVWLHESAKGSKILGLYNNFYIPNCIDFSEFKILDKLDCRKELNLPEDKIILLFVSASTANRRKGFDLLIDALQIIYGKHKNIYLIALGKSDRETFTSLPIEFAGEVNDNIILNKYYSAADAFLLPSREDNLPNVMLEAFACGLPIIGTPVGGVKENVIEKNGVMAKDISGQGLAGAINHFMENRQLFSATEIREYAKTIFSNSKIVEQFLESYKGLIS